MRGRDRVVAPGTTVGAFRVERLIGAGSTGAVYEATQLSLRRTVALRLVGAGHFTTPEQLVGFDHRQHLAASLHHPNVVPCYEVGEWEGGGRFIATRLIRGSTLADLRSQGATPAAESVNALVGALEAAHASGLVHGRVSEQNILLERNGTPHLADLGLAEQGSPQADSQALAALLAQLPPRADSRRDGSGRWTLRIALVGLAGLASAALAVLLGGGEEDPASLGPPASSPGTTPVGSGLFAAAVQPLGCGQGPSSSGPGCTLALSELEGRPVTVRRPGVIRSWAIRGASGELALQVIRERDGESFVVGFSQPERPTTTAPQAFAANIGVRPGDRIGISLSPGASIGVRVPSAGAAIARWDGGLTADSRAVDAMLEGELMLRADLEPGALPENPAQLVGKPAASAPAGRALADIRVGLSDQRPARVVLVELPGGIALDLVARRRLSRLDVPDANPDGELVDLDQNCGPVVAGGFCLRWRNPGEELVLEHAYRVRGSGRIELIG